jgi:putative phage-type endonuclease
MEDRKSYIGGSDIAAAMGVSRWKTPLQLWAEKTGQVEPEDISEKEYVVLGSELEEFIARKFERKTGIKVRRAPCRYVSQTHPFMACQIDRLCTGTEDLLECKNVSAWKAKEWEGEEIPIEYILQVSWQLMITKRKTGYIAALVGGNKFLWKKVEADQELFDKMFAVACDFWKMVEDKVPPVAESDDNRFMLELYPTAGDQIKEASQDVTTAIAQLQLTKAEIINLEKVKDDLEAKLKAVIGDALGIRTPEYTAKWISVKGSTFTVTKPDSRMLRITKNKGGEDESIG